MRLSRGEQAVAGAIVFLAILGTGWFVAYMPDAWVYGTGIGVGVVLSLVHRWAEGTER